MNLDAKPFEDICAEDVLALIPDVAENRRIDYKKCLPDTGEKGVRSFLNDVCALANSSGGFLVYGVEEAHDDDDKPTGVPMSVCGVGDVNEDRNVLEWQQRIGQCIEPRLIGHRIRFIGGFQDDARVMLVYIPKSLFSPHWVNYAGKREFRVRHDRGNQLMDIGEIRHAFVEARQLPERIEEYRRLRASQVLANEAPIALLEGMTVMIHFMPLSSYGADAPLIELVGMNRRQQVRCIGVDSYINRLNFDGRLFHGGHSDEYSRVYAQFYRDGKVEMVMSEAKSKADARAERADTPYIRSSWFEMETIRSVQEVLGLLTQLGAKPPIYAGLTLMRVKGWVMARPHSNSFDMRDIPPIDRDVLFTPLVTADDLAVDAGRLMKPAFDAIWQASGLAESPYYDDEGNWKGR